PHQLLALGRERPVAVGAPPVRPALGAAVPQEVDLHHVRSLSSTACSRARATNHSCALSGSSPSPGQTCVQLPSAPSTRVLRLSFRYVGRISSRSRRLMPSSCTGKRIS